MTIQSLFALRPFTILAVGISRIYCTIKEI